MEAEIHLTMDVVDISEFIEYCRYVGVKPIVIQTDNIDGVNQQVMSSSKYQTDDIQIVLENLINLFSGKYSIIRQKIEIKPDVNKHPHHIYFESHLRLKLLKEFVLDKSMCDKLDVHISKNFLKQDNLYNYQMLTYRKYDISFIDFKNNLNNIIKNINLDVDKIETEECIYDTNINIDDDWLKK